MLDLDLHTNMCNNCEIIFRMVKEGFERDNNKALVSIYSYAQDKFNANVKTMVNKIKN